MNAINTVSRLAGLADFLRQWHSIHPRRTEHPPAPVSEELAQTLGRFIAAWQATRLPPFGGSVQPRELAGRLERFIDAWRAISDTIAPRPVVAPIDRSALVPELTALLRDLEPALRSRAEHRRMGADINVWKVSDLGTDELRNSTVLAWLLDYRGSHGQGHALLAGLIEAAVESGVKRFPSPQDATLPYWTYLESCPLGDRESRVDIEIDGESLLLFIEVKIRAPETGNQLDRYLDLGRAKTGGRPWGVIYLTCDRALPARYQGAGPDMPLVALSWRDLVTIIDRHLKTLPDCPARQILGQFADHIRSFL